MRTRTTSLEKDTTLSLASRTPTYSTVHRKYIQLLCHRKQPDGMYSSKYKHLLKIGVFFTPNSPRNQVAWVYFIRSVLCWCRSSPNPTVIWKYWHFALLQQLPKELRKLSTLQQLLLPLFRWKIKAGSTIEGNCFHTTKQWYSWDYISGLQTPIPPVPSLPTLPPGLETHLEQQWRPASFIDGFAFFLF